MSASATTSLAFSRSFPCRLQSALHIPRRIRYGVYEGLNDYVIEGWTPCPRGFVQLEVAVAHPDAFKNVIVVSDVEFYATIGKVDLLRTALDARGNPNARDPDGYTALHGASENGHVDCVRLLLKRGADPAPRTRDDLTPLDLAEMCEHDRVADLLVQAGGD